MQEYALTESKSLRDENAGKVEVLASFGFNLKLTGVPLKAVAEFYGVSEATIRKLVERNREEFESDGLKLMTYQESIENTQTGQDVTIEIGPRGTNFFPPRAVLRAGMLLRDSEKAKQVRTALLNVVEKVAEAVAMTTSEHPLMTQARQMMEITAKWCAVEAEQKRLATNQANHARRLEIVEESTEAFRNPNGGYYTVLAWARKNHCIIDAEIARKIGMDCRKESIRRGIPISRVPDAKYEHVNTYHETVLAAVFGQYENLEFNYAVGDYYPDH